MAKNKDDDLDSKSGNIPQEGELKEQLAERAPKGEGIGESSLSPIETW